MRNLFRTLIVCTAVLAVAAVVLPSYSFAAETATERVVVQFKAGHRAAVVQATETPGSQMHYEFDALNAVVMTLSASEIDRLRNDPNVLSVEEDVLRYPADQTIPYGIENIEARDTWDVNHDGQIDGNAPTGTGRTICIIDSGIDADHEDFAGVNIVGGYPAGWNVDNYGHGTHVVGTIAAANNSTGVVGVTPGTASLYIVKVFGDTGGWIYSSTLVDAALHCQSAGANIITMSLVGSHYSSYENNAFQYLYDQGLLIVAAAGNGGGTAYGYPASYNSSTN